MGFEVGYLTSINVNENDKDNEQGNCLSFSRDLSSKISKSVLELFEKLTTILTSILIGFISYFNKA